jgi:hypothetical protein
MVAIGNAIFVRDRNSLTKNEQSMRLFVIQTGPDVEGISLYIPAGILMLPIHTAVLL